MKKTNQANILAKEYITAALIQLGMEKPFSTISISELTERAGVSRMTYYRNYSSKEEVFQTYMKDIVISYREDMQRMKRTQTYGEYENILQCFRYFSRYKDFINCIIKIGMGKLLLDALNAYLLDTYYNPEHPSVRLYYTLQAYAGALFNVYMAWLSGGMKESAEELTDIIYSQIHPNN